MENLKYICASKPGKCILFAMLEMHSRVGAGLGRRAWAEGPALKCGATVSSFLYTYLVLPKVKSICASDAWTCLKPLGCSTMPFP